MDVSGRIRKTDRYSVLGGYSASFLSPFLGDGPPWEIYSDAPGGGWSPLPADFRLYGAANPYKVEFASVTTSGWTTEEPAIRGVRRIYYTLPLKRHLELVERYLDQQQGDADEVVNEHEEEKEEAKVSFTDLLAFDQLFERCMDQLKPGIRRHVESLPVKGFINPDATFDTLFGHTGYGPVTEAVPLCMIAESPLFNVFAGRPQAKKSREDLVCACLKDSQIQNFVNCRTVAAPKRIRGFMESEIFQGRHHMMDLMGRKIKKACIAYMSRIMDHIRVSSLEEDMTAVKRRLSVCEDNNRKVMCVMMPTQAKVATHDEM